MSITVQELENAEKSMQQQWHALAMAEQRGEPLEMLEQMYDRYILLAEEYNLCSEKFQREEQGEQAQSERGHAVRGGKKQPFLGREKEREDIKLAS